MHSPFKTIFRKEWKQSSVLRRVSILLMVLLPPFVIMMAESASRGWIPMFSINSYDVTQLFMDAIPMILVLGWAFFAALFTAQAFAGDRSTGNESFLLERPVARTVTWRARLAAVTTNGVIILVAGWLIWLGYFLVLGDPIEGTYLKLSGLFLGSGLIVILATICGTMAATAFLDSPMIAVLGGLILAALPVGAAVFLGGLSPFAVLFRLDHDVFPSPLITLSQLPVGMILPVLLYPAFIAVSWWTLCKGEPAGRGSRARGARILIPSILGVLVLFLILAPLAVRANVNAHMNNGQIYPSPAAGRCVLTGGWMASGGWLMDTETGKKLHFFGTPIIEVAWSADGSKVAADVRGRSINWPGSFRSRVVVLDGESAKVVASHGMDPGLELYNLAWIGDSLLITTLDYGLWQRLKKTDRAGDAIRFFLSSPTGEADGRLLVDLKHDLALPGISWYDWRIIPTAEETKAFIIAIAKEPIGEDEKKAGDRTRDRTIIFHQAHIDGASIQSRKIGEVPFGLSGNSNALSRSGRYLWTLVPKSEDDRSRSMRLYDLSAGEEVDLGAIPDVVWPNWLAQDEVIWVERGESANRLQAWNPESGITTVFETPLTERLMLDTSPNGLAVLISGSEPLEDGTQNMRRTGTWLYEARSGKVVPFETDYEGYIRGRFWTNWADPGTVLRSGDSGAYFESVREPGKTVQIR